MELMQWINSLLALTVTSLRQLHNGAVYCQIVDAHAESAAIPMRRVKWDAHRGFDTLTNYKILQAALERIRFNGPVLVDRLVSGNMSAHMEFLQCLGAWFRERTERIEYDPVAARHGPMPAWACSVNQMWVDSTGSPAESPEKRTLADSMLWGAAEGKQTRGTSTMRRPRSGPPSLARSGRTGEPSLAQAAEATRQRFIEMENAALRLWCGQASPTSTQGVGCVNGSSTSVPTSCSVPCNGEAQAMHRALENARCCMTRARSSASSQKFSVATEVSSEPQRDVKSSSASVQRRGSPAVQGAALRPCSRSPSPDLSEAPRSKLRTPSRVASQVASRESSLERAVSRDPISRNASGCRIPLPPKAIASLTSGVSQNIDDTATFTDFQAAATPMALPCAPHEGLTSFVGFEQQCLPPHPVVLPVSDDVTLGASKTFGSSGDGDWLQQVNLIEALLREGAAQLADNDQRLASFSAQSDRLEVAVRDLKAQLGKTAPAA